MSPNQLLEFHLRRSMPCGLLSPGSGHLECILGYDAFHPSTATVLEPSVIVKEFVMALVIPDKSCDSQMKLTSLGSESLEALKGKQTKQSAESQRKKH